MRILSKSKTKISNEMNNVPYHVGIIIDGNRRWARKRGLPALEGHRQGLEKVKKVIKWCKARGIKILTFYIFSTENWSRSKIEVYYLMKLLKRVLTKDIETINKEGFRVQIIGQKWKLSPQLQKLIKKAEELTKNNKEGILNLAVSYGGRAEIVEAIKKIIEKKIPSAEITQDLVSQNLWTGNLPESDLIIRTGGEKRISNFLIWQAAYAELYFCPKYWPDFTEKDLDEALVNFASRQRRFGK